MIQRGFGGPSRPILSQSGNVFFALFGAVALMGVLGAASTTVLKGPVAGMQRVTKYTVAENNMIAAGKLALIAATNQPMGGDCDGDDMVEPIPFSLSGDGPYPVGGGYLPPDVGAARQDPWGNIFGYCVWDHGFDPLDDSDNDGQCGGASNFRAGADSEQYIVLALVSSGPDRVFQTICHDFDPANPEAPLVAKAGGSDDLVLAYTYAEAGSMSGGLWKLKSGDSDTAEIGARNVEIAGSGGGGEAARIGFDENLGLSGVGEFMAIKTDNIYSKTPAGHVAMQSPLQVQLVDLLDEPDEDGGGGGGGARISGEIAAFALDICPDGWSEYAPAQGRFLRGIDRSGANDVVRAAGNIQADALGSHTHTGTTSSAGAHNHIIGRSDYPIPSSGAWSLRSVGTSGSQRSSTDGAHTHSFTTNATGAAETRPRNVAVLYCIKD